MERTFIIPDGDAVAGQVRVAAGPSHLHLSVDTPEQAVALIAALDLGEPRRTEGVTQLGSTWAAVDAYRNVGALRLSVCCMQVNLSEQARAAS